ALFDLGRLLRRIHNLDLADLQGSGLFPGDGTAAEALTRIEDQLRHVAEAMAASEAGADLPNRVMGLMDGLQPDQLVALHSNPGPEHVFLDPPTLMLNGIIDFGDAFVSHP